MVDFSKKNKRTMAVIMPDGRKLLILPPTKKLIGLLTSFDADLGMNQETIDSIYEIAAMILSNNMQKKKITLDNPALEELDIDDVTSLVTDYINFTNEIRSSPN